MATSIELVVALPDGTTATVYLDPVSMVLVEIHTDGTLAYVPADEVTNLVLYSTPEEALWVDPPLNYVVAGVISSQPSDHAPSPGGLEFDTYPSWCICTQTTDVTQLVRITE